MNDKEIDDLINKALREEQALPKGLSERLERQIDSWAAEEEKKTRSFSLKRSLYWVSGIAAAILLCIGIFQYSTPLQPHEQMADTYTNPKEAAATAQKALLLMSQNLNKGFNQMDNAQQEINKVNNILNKHLND